MSCCYIYISLQKNQQTSYFYRIILLLSVHLVINVVQDIKKYSLNIVYTFCGLIIEVEQFQEVYRTTDNLCTAWVLYVVQTPRRCILLNLFYCLKLNYVSYGVHLVFATVLN